METKIICDERENSLYNFWSDFVWNTNDRKHWKRRRHSGNETEHKYTHSHVRTHSYSVVCSRTHTHIHHVRAYTKTHTKLGITWTLLVDGTTVFIATRKVLHTTHLIRHRHQPININTRKEAIHKQKSQIFETKKATAAKSWLSFARYFANRMFCWNFDIILLNGRAFPIDRTKNRKKPIRKFDWYVSSVRLLFVVLSEIRFSCDLFLQLYSYLVAQCVDNFELVAVFKSEP